MFGMLKPEATFPDLSSVNFPKVNSKTSFGNYYYLLVGNLSGDNLKVFNSLKTYYQNYSISNNGSDLTRDTTVNDFLNFYQEKGCRDANGVGNKYEAIADEILSKIRDNLT